MQTTTLLLISFFLSAALLWLSLYGYVFILAAVALLRRRDNTEAVGYPKIAVVVPTLNEENLILGKLRNLKDCDYPKDKVTFVVVDGGSTDKTAKPVRHEIENGEAIQLVSFSGSSGQADQIKNIIDGLSQDYVVVTDVDSTLEPSCIRELIHTLLSCPDTAVVGALVQPASNLLEERIHWWFQNYMWWLEGEAVASTGVSGVCYAVRRSAVVPITKETRALDINLTLATASRGLGVRICRKAKATETRVPQSAREFISFRRRRGAAYLEEILQSIYNTRPTITWRLVRFMRRWHFCITPKIAVVLAALAFVLLWTPQWNLPILTFLAFVGPACLAVLLSSTLASSEESWWHLWRATIRFLVLTLISLLTLGYRPARSI